MGARLGGLGRFLRPGSFQERLRLTLIESSPLRKADPRLKLGLSLGVTLAVMLPLSRLVFFSLVYLALLLWARLLPGAARQVWRMRWLLLGLFLLDWWLISLEHAATICLRLGLLASVFTLFFSTTTSGELNLALESLGVPYRYAFSLSLAFSSLNLLDEEWQAIKEAQASRGALPAPGSWRKLFRQIGDYVALTIPAVVLTTKRAWSITEAAHARGFESPHRRPYRQLKFSRFDLLLFVITLSIFTFFLLWR